MSRVEDILKNLKCRFDQQKVTCDTIFVDDCCKVCSKLQQIFPKCQLSLTCLMPSKELPLKCQRTEKHYLSSSFIDDFKMIFRADADQGEIRAIETPDEQTIMSNLERLTERWKDVKYGTGEAVLNANVMHEIVNLKEHIERACLSGIPVGGGSTRN